MATKVVKKDTNKERIPRIINFYCTVPWKDTSIAAYMWHGEEDIDRSAILDRCITVWQILIENAPSQMMRGNAENWAVGIIHFVWKERGVKNYPRFLWAFHYHATAKARRITDILELLGKR